MRTFELHRHEDETGVSGTGIVAEGVEFGDGSMVLRWLTTHSSMGFYKNKEDMLAIHGHNGKTEMVLTGGPFERAFDDAFQDSMENSPFACVGGPEKRTAMVAPKWITPQERDRYISGYQHAAQCLYGKDWRTVTFQWGPAITIPGTNESAPTE